MERKGHRQPAQDTIHGIDYSVEIGTYDGVRNTSHNTSSEEHCINNNMNPGSSTSLYVKLSKPRSYLLEALDVTYDASAIDPGILKMHFT